MNLRELILDMLLELEKNNGYSHVLMRNVLDKHDYLSGRDKAFVKRIVEGTLERRIQLDYIIDRFSKTPVSKMKPLIRNLIRMSVYQIMFMDSVPDSAVCNEAVKLASKRKFQSLKGFVNGVLRTIARQKEEIEYPSPTNVVEYLSVYYSMPEHLTRLFIREHGEERAKQLLEALLAIRPVTIRLREDMDQEQAMDLLDEMEEQGIEVGKHPYLSYAYQLGGVEGVRNIPGYDEGLFAVQDVSSMLCVEAAQIKKGMQIIDVCAAPGGKAVHAAIKLMGEGTVYARDISEEKVALIKENQQRQRIDCMQAEVFDAGVFDEKMEKKADIVFADLPCSGLGVMGRKRDIKYHVTQESLPELPKLQREILSTVWKYIKPGGTLIYSTCTIHREENEKMVQWLLENFPFTAVDISGSLPGVGEAETCKGGYIQLLPGIHDTDGFFIAKLKRNTEES